MIMFYNQIAGQNHSLQIINQSFKNVEKFVLEQQ
jgi:hypothetical protein